MSNVLLNACRPVQIPPTAKNVLMAIADRADEGGLAWPSIPGLCEATCYSRSAVIEAVKWLEHEGLMRTERTLGRNNRFKINIERIKAVRGHVRQSDASASRTRVGEIPVRAMDPARATAAPPPVRQADLPVLELDPNHHKEPSNHHVPTDRPSQFDTHFAEFWDAYPRKVAKERARKAFAKYRPNAALLETMLAAIARQRASTQWTKDAGQFIPHPASWLNGERWNDECGSQGVPASPAEWLTRAGFANQFEAGNEGCFEHNADEFRDGKRVGVPA